MIARADPCRRNAAGGFFLPSAFQRAVPAPSFCRVDVKVSGTGSGMNQKLVDHPHAKSSWITMRIHRHEETHTVLVVATDLVLNPDDPRYNGEAVSDLAEAVTAYISAHILIDSADVIPI
jgi:hypothetical protein